MSSDLLKAITHKLEALNIKPTAQVLHVSIERQELVVFANGRETRRFQVSTSKSPPNCEENSFGTPTGLHRIESKIGDGATVGTLFKGRVDIKKNYDELSKEERKPNLITSRILWLTGLEPGNNQGSGHDSYERYIYIHGTNHEDKIGKPSSGGCILLRNKEMIELFDRVSTGEFVFISQ